MAGAWLLWALLACATCAQSAEETAQAPGTVVAVETEEDGSIEPEYSFHIHPDHKESGQVICRPGLHPE
jgi:hypothetical protein